MLRVGLTGGIGSGKTTIANLFAEKHVPLIDADVIAHDLVVPGSQALAEITDRFGARVVADDGGLDRAYLRQLIFECPDKKRQLESILHPLVFQEIETQIARLRAKYCIVVIPLLIETGAHEIVDRILVVDCPPALQIKRVTDRDQVEREHVLRIIESQSSRREKLRVADDVIVNDNGTDRIRTAVKRLHRFYLATADEGGSADR